MKVRILFTYRGDSGHSIDTAMTSENVERHPERWADYIEELWGELAEGSIDIFGSVEIEVPDDAVVVAYGRVKQQQQHRLNTDD